MAKEKTFWNFAREKNHHHHPLSIFAATTPTPPPPPPPKKQQTKQTKQNLFPKTNFFHLRELFFSFYCLIDLIQD
jgi:hypothetical protein